MRPFLSRRLADDTESRVIEKTSGTQRGDSFSRSDSSVLFDATIHGTH